MLSMDRHSIEKLHFTYLYKKCRQALLETRDNLYMLSCTQLYLFHGIGHFGVSM